MVVCNRTCNGTSEDGTSNHWDRFSGTTIQDNPIGNQDPCEKTEYRITWTDLPGQRIRTTQSEYQDPRKKDGYRTVKVIVDPSDLQYPCKNDGYWTVKVIGDPSDLQDWTVI